MQQAIIIGHPDAGSFTRRIAEAYCAALREKGHEPVVRDLYQMGFDPCLKLEEIPKPGGFEPGADVIAERALLKDASIFVFFYPLWFYAPPAIVKGYMDRVFSQGFGFKTVVGGGVASGLGGKKLLSFTATGAPSFWLEADGDWGAIRKLFDQHFAAVCGLEVLDHVHFGGVHRAMAPEAIDRAVTRVREVAARYL
jgi:NAD(P)H dehydrogenase (quinone)